MKIITRIIDMDILKGVTPFGPIQIDALTTSVGVYILRCTSADPSIWPSKKDALRLEIEASLDDGETWAVMGGCGANGGIHEFSPLTESPYTGTTVKVPLSDKRRWVKGTLVAVGEVNTAVDFVEIS